MSHLKPPALLGLATAALFALLAAAEFSTRCGEQVLARGYYTRGRTSQFYARGTPKAPPAAVRSR